MRNRATLRLAKRAYTALRQIVQLIPEGLPGRIARDTKADIQSFSCASHVLTRLCGQLTKASSLDEICGAARRHEPELNRTQGRRFLLPETRPNRGLTLFTPAAHNR